MLIAANLSYKMPNISEKDKINVIWKNVFHFTIFSVHSKIIFMYTVYTGAHREDHCIIAFKKIANMVGILAISHLVIFSSLFTHFCYGYNKRRFARDQLNTLTSFCI